MSDVFINNIKIDKVRHLENFNIPLSKEKRKNLIITGKNGSGKTSILEAMAARLSYFTGSSYRAQNTDGLVERNTNLNIYNRGVSLDFNFTFTLEDNLLNLFGSGDFIIAYYNDHRKYQVQNEKFIDNIEIKKTYKIDDSPNKQFVKYLVSLKTKEALSAQKGEMDRANEISKWFKNFESLMKILFDDNSLVLDFNIDTFAFSIIQDGKEPFDFATLSSGYAAILEIITDLMMRMENKKHYQMQGIVLIDEIETHLHLELQKNILPFLTTTFPNIQFIVTTHSPFVITSDSNTIVFDLEHKLTMEDLTNYSYEGVIEGYFNVTKLSNELKKDFTRYKELINKENKTNIEHSELAKLEVKLDEVPDILNLDFAAEYKKLRLDEEFE